MASLELTPLSEHLDDDEIEALAGALAETGAGALDVDDDGDPLIIDSALDDDIFADFLDRLEANEAYCDIYVPAEFEDAVEVAGHKVGSAHALMLVLESMKEDFFVEEDEESEDAVEADDELADDFDELDEDETSGLYDTAGDGAIELKDEELRKMWRQMYRGAKTAVARRLALFVHT
jgi:hypothetical protein